MSKRIFLVFCALTYGASLFAQEDNELYLSDNIDFVLAQANRALDQRQYDQAAERYEYALRLKTPLPEAEYGLGMVLHAEGIRGAAERKYILAISQRAHLRVSELVYEIQYRLADLYLEGGQRAKYQAVLEQISDDDTYYANSSLRRNIKRIVYQRGMDRLFELYRFDAHFALSAHAQLGEHYVRSGNYGAAVEHLLFAYLLHAQQLYEISAAHILQIDQLSYSELFAHAHLVTPITNQLNHGYDIYRILFYLGSALYGDSPRSQTWSEAWLLISSLDVNSPWILRARVRLQDPQVEQLYS